MMDYQDDMETLTYGTVPERARRSLRDRARLEGKETEGHPDGPPPPAGWPPKQDKPRPRRHPDGVRPLAKFPQESR